MNHFCKWPLHCPLLKFYNFNFGLVFKKKHPQHYCFFHSGSSSFSHTIIEHMCFLNMLMLILDWAITILIIVYYFDVPSVMKTACWSWGQIISIIAIRQAAGAMGMVEEAESSPFPPPQWGLREGEGGKWGGASLIQPLSRHQLDRLTLSVYRLVLIDLLPPLLRLLDEALLPSF